MTDRSEAALVHVEIRATLRCAPSATIGYEQTALRDFVQTLREEGIACVIDVRDLPQSRRAGFSKRQLAASLEEAGIGYVHLKGLGTPKEGRVANRQRNYPLFWEIVERQLARPEADLDLQRAAEVAGRQPSVLLCYEADPHVCHRDRVAALLQERFGFATRHLKVRFGAGAFGAPDC